MAKRKEFVLTAEEIQQKWDTEAKGKEWIPAKAFELADLRNEKADLTGRVNDLEKQLVKKISSVSQLRERLDEVLRTFGIEAAFEPLIHLATDTYPMDYGVIELRGEFKCSIDQRIKIWTELLSYQLPKLKAMELSGTVDNSITVIIKRFGGEEIAEKLLNPTPPVIDVPVEKTIMERNLVKIKKYG